jgi:glucan phosphoethanolaminetransferase (alkaline phosphatase superfamily)
MLDMSLQKIGRLFILFFAGFLPWSVIVSVTGTERFHLEIFRFTKEIFLVFILVIGIIDMWKKKYRPKFDLLDGTIFIYVLTLMAISF